MNWRLVSRLLGLLALLIASSMLLSLPWSWPQCGQTAVFERQALRGMLLSIGVSVLTGLLLAAVGRRPRGTVLRKESLAVVGLGWILCGVLGSLPYLLTPTYRLPGVPMSVADAVFESISGFSTTGASVLTQLEVPENITNCEAAATAGLIAYVPRSVLFWRSFTHWLGGMGIIVLFVAILGQLGAGGKALMRREVPGPVSDTLRPRVRETAVIMWTIYFVLSLVLTAILLAEGMTWYDALCHTFGTMATGGFSTRNASAGAFNSPLVEITLIVFMVAAGTNFNLYYVLLRQPRRPGDSERPSRLRLLFQDAEFRAYLAVIGLSTAVLSAVLLLSPVHDDGPASIRHAAFSVVSIMTTTGFATENFSEWPVVSQAWLTLLMYVGGCSGSTGGGIKVIRFLVLFRVLKLEIERAFRPNLVRPVRIADNRVQDAVCRDVLLYFCLIAVISAVSWLVLVGLEPVTQWELARQPESVRLTDCASAVAATLNNIGPGLGVCGSHGNYTLFTDSSKLLLTLLMLLGRLELFAVIVLFVPRFWTED